MKNVKWLWLAALVMGAMSAGCPSGGEGNGDDDDDVCDGDGRCTGDETKSNCPEDCDPCGNNVCDAGETSQSCAADCPVTCNNNKVCDPNESQQTCPGDCTAPSTICGDNLCNGSETAGSCAADCTAKLRTQNNSSYTIFYLYLRSCSSTTWSANQIPTTVISPGQSLTLTGIPFGCWFFRAEDSGHVHRWENPTGAQLTNNTPYPFTLIN